jgi:hypothetical protein
MGAIPVTDNDLITTTLVEWQPKLFDNISKHIPLWSRLRKGGHIRHVNGGSCLEVDLMYAENPTFKWFSGTDQLLTTKANTMQPAYFNWYMANENVIITGEDWAKNKGNKTRKYSLLESLKDNAMKTIMNKFGALTWSDGTSGNAKEMPGMGLLVQDTPAGQVGTINRDTELWWRNQTRKWSDYGTGSADNTKMPTGAQIMVALGDMVRRLTVNGDRPSVIFCHPDLYALYEAQLVALKRFNGDDKADGSFKGLKFQGIDVLWDPNIKAGHMYFLNEQYIHLNVHPDLDFKFDMAKKPVNQYMEIYPLYFMGGFTISNCAKQGVIWCTPSTTSEYTFAV